MDDIFGKTILTVGGAILIVPVKPLLITAAVGGALAAGALYYAYDCCKEV